MAPDGQRLWHFRTTATAQLARASGSDLQHSDTGSLSLVAKILKKFRHGGVQDRSVQSGLRPDVRARLSDRACSRAQHVTHLQPLDHDQLVRSCKPFRLLVKMGVARIADGPVEPGQPLANLCPASATPPAARQSPLGTTEFALSARPRPNIRDMPIDGTVRPSGQMLDADVEPDRRARRCLFCNNLRAFHLQRDKPVPAVEREGRSFDLRVGRKRPVQIHPNGPARALEDQILPSQLHARGLEHTEATPAVPALEPGKARLLAALHAAEEPCRGILNPFEGPTPHIDGEAAMTFRVSLPDLSQGLLLVQPGHGMPGLGPGSDPLLERRVIELALHLAQLSHPGILPGPEPQLVAIGNQHGELSMFTLCSIQPNIP